jgi:2-keto-4-pentenoate hydratase
MAPRVQPLASSGMAAENAGNQRSKTPMMSDEQVHAAARMLLAARHDPAHRLAALPDELTPPDMEACLAIQAAAAEHVSIGGWKVGVWSKTEFFCAPMPAHGIHASPAALGAGLMRGVEAEVAFHIGHSLPPRETPYSREEVIRAMTTAHPAIELLESAFLDPDSNNRLSNLADSMMHGSFVHGPGVADWHDLDFPAMTVTQSIAGLPDLQRTGNPAGEMVRLVEWLANVGSVWAGGLHAGQYVTCGSWTGKTLAPAGAAVRVAFAGLGEARAQFAA